MLSASRGQWRFFSALTVTSWGLKRRFSSRKSRPWFLTCESSPTAQLHLPPMSRPAYDPLSTPAANQDLVTSTWTRCWLYWEQQDPTRDIAFELAVKSTRRIVHTLAFLQIVMPPRFQLLSSSKRWLKKLIAATGTTSSTELPYTLRTRVEALGKRRSHDLANTQCA